MPSFIKLVQAVKKLNSISRERLNFRRRPILCTTLYRNLMQAPNFGGTFDQLFLWIFSWNFYRRCLSTFSTPWCQKVKNDQKLKSRGGPALMQLSYLLKRWKRFFVFNWKAWKFCFFFLRLRMSGGALELYSVIARPVNVRVDLNLSKVCILHYLCFLLTLCLELISAAQDWRGASSDTLLSEM